MRVKLILIGIQQRIWKGRWSLEKDKQSTDLITLLTVVNCLHFQPGTVLIKKVFLWILFSLLLDVNFHISTLKLKNVEDKSLIKFGRVLKSIHFVNNWNSSHRWHFDWESFQLTSERHLKVGCWLPIHAIFLHSCSWIFLRPFLPWTGRLEAMKWNFPHLYLINNVGFDWRLKINGWDWNSCWLFFYRLLKRASTKGCITTVTQLKLE